MLNLIHPICFVKHLFYRCESCLRYKISVSPLLLQSAVVVWFGSVRTFCRRKWFLTITCFRWRKYQWKRWKKRSDESNLKERLKTPCHQQCRYGANKYRIILLKHGCVFKLNYRGTAATEQSRIQRYQPEQSCNIPLELALVTVTAGHKSSLSSWWLTL